MAAATIDASVAGKVALVTGGTGAIGSAVVKQLAAQGCRVIVVDLDQAKCAAAAAALPTSTTGIAINVADETSVSDGVDSALRALGVEGVDILVNIAGILSNNNTANDAQDIGSTFGKVLRLDVDGPSNYVPADNPFVGVAGGRSSGTSSTIPKSRMHSLPSAVRSRLPGCGSQ